MPCIKYHRILSVYGVHFGYTKSMKLEVPFDKSE